MPVAAGQLARLRAAGRSRGWPAYLAVIADLASEIPGFGGVDRRTGSAPGYASRPQPEPGPLVSVARLRARDVPDLVAPPGADLVQVLWCPNDHDLDGVSYGPAVLLRWRREAEPSGAADYQAATEPTGVIAGRTGLYRVFHCTHCPDAHPRVDLQ